MSARRRPNDDLFAESTMTFGEHLEELRACLFKSVLALLLTTIIGLLPFVGGGVVNLIKAPLERALAEYYERQTTENVQKVLAAERPGVAPAKDETARITAFVEKNHLLMEQVLVNPDWVMHELRRHDPKRFGAIAPGGDAEVAIVPQRREDMVPLMLFRATEDDARMHARSFSPQEAFVIYIKASLLVGVILASPYIFYQIWSFVAAGLYAHEKYYVHLFLPFSLGLFLSGAILAFLFVFEPVLSFLFSFNRAMGIEVEPRITEWMSFVLVMPLGFGISFQLPLVMLFLERIGVFSVKAYLKQWRVAVLVIFFLAAILTPSPDPYSMLLMAIPLTMLFFGGILLCMHLPRRRGPFDEE
jgi:sec-independent protein translocase protein TatC